MPLHKPLLRRPLLRKSPVRTRVLLSANRANALRSTGPRTARGKHASALNALRHGRRAQRSLSWVPQAGCEADAFWSFEAQLRDAILPLAGKGEQQVFDRALSLWITKRLYDRLAASADEDQRMRLAIGVEPMPASYRSRILRPGKSVPDWMVTVSIGVAWGRGLGRFQQYATETANDMASGKEPSPFRRMPRLPSLHVRLVLTTVGHPYSDDAHERQGAAAVERGPDRRTKPESLTKQAGFENDPYSRGSWSSVQMLGGTAQGQEGHDGPDGFSKLDLEAASAPHSRRVSYSKAGSQPAKANRRTKPECTSKSEVSKNEPPSPTHNGDFRKWVSRAISGVRNYLRKPFTPPDHAF